MGQLSDGQNRIGQGSKCRSDFKRSVDLTLDGPLTCCRTSRCSVLHRLQRWLNRPKRPWLHPDPTNDTVPVRYRRHSFSRIRCWLQRRSVFQRYLQVLRLRDRRRWRLQSLYHSSSRPAGMCVGQLDGGWLPIRLSDSDPYSERCSSGKDLSCCLVRNL